MKKILIILTFLVILVAGFYFIQGTKTAKYTQKEQSNLKDYFSPYTGLKFKYPSNWVQSQKIVDGPNPQIAQFARKHSDGKSIDTNSVINVSHFSNEKNNTLEQLYNEFKKADEFAPGFSGFIKEESYTVNARNVKSYEVIVNDTKAYVNVIMAGDSTKIFVITYGALATDFDKYLSEVKGIIQTVETRE